MLPKPEDKPLLTPDELVDYYPRSRSALYEDIASGAIPSIRYGRRIFIPTALIRRQWGLDMDAAEPAGPADTLTDTDEKGPRDDHDKRLHAC